MSESPEIKPDADWSEARPALIPKPTFSPAFMAFGITFLLWGLITSPVVLIAGLAVVIVSVTRWIGEIRHEKRRL